MLVDAASFLAVAAAVALVRQRVGKETEIDEPLGRARDGIVFLTSDRILGS